MKLFLFLVLFSVNAVSSSVLHQRCELGIYEDYYSCEVYCVLGEKCEIHLDLDLRNVTLISSSRFQDAEYNREEGTYIGSDFIVKNQTVSTKDELEDRVMVIMFFKPNYTLFKGEKKITTIEITFVEIDLDALSQMTKQIDSSIDKVKGFFNDKLDYFSSKIENYKKVFDQDFTSITKEIIMEFIVLILFFVAIISCACFRRKSCKCNLFRCRRFNPNDQYYSYEILKSEV